MMMTGPGGSNDSTTESETTSDTTVVELIKRLQRGEISGKSLALDERRACVEYLTAEGYSSAEIAGILRVADRTVIRDRKAVRESNAVQADESLVGEMVGRLVNEADTAVSRLRRIARDRVTPPAVKVDAERTCWHVVSGLVSSLQKLGYLPTATQQLSAELTHTLRDERAPQYQEINIEIARIESALGNAADALPPGAAQELAVVRDEVNRLVLGERVARLAQGITDTDLGETNGQVADDQSSDDGD